MQVKSERNPPTIFTVTVTLPSMSFFFFHMKKDTEIKERKNCNNSQKNGPSQPPNQSSLVTGERTKRARNQFHCLQTCQRLLGIRIPRQAQSLGFVTQVGALIPVGWAQIYFKKL